MSVEEESEDDMGKEKDTNPDNDDTKKTVFERRQEEVRNFTTKPFLVV